MALEHKSKENFVPPRILVVDDDAIFRQEFVELFEDLSIAQASNGAEAIQFLKKPNEIDLVFLDVRMIGMSGIEVLEKIKQIAPDVRVVIFTGYGSKNVAVEALRNRADDYLEKPFSLKATQEVIEKHLGARERQKYSGSLEDKIKHVKDFLTRNSHKKVTLNDVADAVYLSPKYISRLFKQYTKMGFNEYKLSLKIEQSKNLLQKNIHTVEQISYDLGYQNPESFIRQFKKLTKLTPSEYRNKFKKGRKISSPKKKKLKKPKANKKPYKISRLKKKKSKGSKRR
ncbi:MAG: response regulator transcription factor [Candidatus Ratteibacteria bacterium]|nr:response regulator transcription factor [Candidatus Ratteibacteria bacterium]